MSTVPGYETSSLFNNLKNHKDSIEGNLTSSQYLETLDSYINKAFQAMLRHTRHVEICIAGLIGWQEHNYRRRVSLLTKKEFTSRAITWLIQTPEYKEREIANLKLDRGVAILVCNGFIDQCRPYTEIGRKSILSDKNDLRIVYDTETRLLKKGGNLSHAVATATHQSDLAMKYRGDVLTKYFRLAIMAAQRDYVNFFNCRINLDDMIADYLLAAERAIDKCDYERGALTSHIQNWFYTARTHCQKTYDSGKEDSLPDDVEIPETDRPSTEENLIARESEATIRFLAKIADPTGVGRKILGIEEYLTVSERRLLGLKNV